MNPHENNNYEILDVDPALEYPDIETNDLEVEEWQ